MDVKQQILALRRLIPIPIVEAKRILSTNGGDVPIAFEKYKQENLQLLSRETGYKTEEIELVYRDQKYDFNKTLSYFNRMIEDQKFDQVKLVGVSDSIFGLVYEFRRLENHEELLSAIMMNQFNLIVSFLTIQLDLKELAEILVKAREEYLSIQWMNSSKKDSKLSNDFRSGELYQNALKKWEESKIAFDRNYGILRRNYDRKHNKN